MTTPADPPTLLDWAEKVGVPILTFIGGYFTSRFTLTKKDQKDLEQKNYENSQKLIEQHDAAYKVYAAAIKTYSDAPQAGFDNFYNIATTGETYFYVLGLISSAILSDKVDVTLRDKVLLRKIKEATDRTLPRHYDTLKTIAQKYGFPYTGDLRLADYEAIYEVSGKYGSTLAWTES